MKTQTEVLKLALKALEKIRDADTAGATPKQITEVRKLYEPTITAIKEALAQPEQEPTEALRILNHIESTLKNGLDASEGFRILRSMLAQPERHELQADGKHPAPCARFCEANAFQIEIRRLKAQLEQPEQETMAYRPWPHIGPNVQLTAEYAREQLGLTGTDQEVFDMVVASIKKTHGIKGELRGGIAVKLEEIGNHIKSDA